MTAEVVVLNKSAIALAADSKVTVGGIRTGKTYDTVNKLFTLSKYHPVGIMIYGNAEFMDYPWETIIKLYRKEKGEAFENTIVDWSKDFTKFLEKFGSIAADDKEHNLRQMCVSWFSSALEEAEDVAIFKDLALGSAEHIALLKEVIQFKIRQITSTDRWLDDNQMSKFIAKHGAVVDDVTKTYIHVYGDDELNKLADQFISAAVFFRAPSPRSSGVVIAGFGEREFFPTALSLETEGYVGAGIKLYQESCIDASRQMTAALRAFAQREMVQRFMSGIDPELYSLMMGTFSGVLAENCLSVLEKYGSQKNKTKKVENTVRKAAEASVKTLAEEVIEITTHSYSDPIVRMVSMLPKDELANLAESLVALTSLKRRVSSDAETVGGAIDVAVISKCDGFVWIKRKYYFPEDINPQFNRMYLYSSQGAGNEEGREPSRGSKRATSAAGSTPPPKRLGKRTSRSNKP